MGEPQAPQNFLLTGWPLEPTSSNERSESPETSKDSPGTPITTEKAVPLCFLQLAQWHAATMRGSDEDS